MAWGLTKVEEKRKEFIDSYLKKENSFTELCREYQISRKNGYKWVARYEKGGVEGLKNQSRAPITQAGKTNDRLISEILKVKQKYMAWGPKKILAILQKDHPSEDCPSTTTIGKILDEHGLVIPRKYRNRLPAKTDPLSHCQQPNDVWCIDFKGWFTTKDNVKCDPLTLTDAYSRFILHCCKLEYNNTEFVWQILDQLFYKHGLPNYMRHDNGPPFATRGAGRLSGLSVKLIKAGVQPEWIEPGKPYQNGRHERMHLTLQKEGVFPLQLTLKEQHMKFKEFQKYFNDERPHEALGQKCPSSVYVPSNRVWTGKLNPPDYSQEYTVKRVRERGQLSWTGKDIFIGKALKDEYIGLKGDDLGNWLVYFGPVLLGVINQQNEFEMPQVASTRSSKYKAQIF